jgi:division protein CdvB (Snf7/Vps24/ESCRT-III family)
MESKLKGLHAAMESKFLECEASGKAHEYRALVKEIESLISKTKQEENDIGLRRHKIKMMESNGDGFHSQYKEEKSRVEGLKKQLEEVKDDVRVALMSDNESHKHRDSLRHELFER